MKKITALIISSLAIGLGACSSSDDNTPTPPGSGGNNSGDAQTALINASDYDTPAYFDFETATTVTASDDWDVGFIRDKVIVNSGKKTAIADIQAEYYQADGVTPANNGQSFANATDATELPSLLNATAIIGDWVESGIKSAIDGGWNIPGHPLQATDQFYIIRSAEGNSYAKITSNAFTFTGRAYEVVFDTYVQGSGENAFSNTVEQITVTSGTDTCYDFDSGAFVDCSTTNWDIKFAWSEHSLPIYTNGGVSGDGQAAVYKIADTEAEADYQHGDFRSADQSGVFSAAWVQDVDASIFADYSWYAYDPLNDGKHQLYSNYRVYVVDTDAADANSVPYKMQITGYYNDSGSSGHYSIRFASLSTNQ